MMIEEMLVFVYIFPPIALKMFRSDENVPEGLVA